MSESFPVPGQRIKPLVDEKKAIKCLESLYGFKIKSLQKLDAYDDINYRVICEEKFENQYIGKVNSSGYVLKITNSLDSTKIDVIEGQTQAMIYLNENGIRCPVPVKQRSGGYFSLESFSFKEGEQEKNVVKLLEFHEGILLENAPITDKLMFQVGRHIAEIGEKLSRFSNSSLENYKTIWSLKSIPELRNFIFAIENPTHKNLVTKIIESFENNVLNVTSKLESAIIHGDLNPHNIIVDKNGKEIRAVIDFGDTHGSFLIFDLAISICYMIVVSKKIEIGKFVLKGYQELRPLREIEKKILKICVCARLCQSLTLGLYFHSLDPKNEYILDSQQNGWKILKKLWPMSIEEILEIWGL